MAAYLIYRENHTPTHGNSSGLHAVIVNGADEAAARAAAQAARPNGGTRIYDGWAAMQLSANDAPQSPIWIEGDIVVPTLGHHFRGQ